jgi:hypothetical protein
MCTADNKPAALPLAPLPCLPEGLCLAVIEQCDMSCKIALSQANRRFHRLIDPYDKSQRPQMENFLIEAQSFPRHQKEDGFAGFACTKILPRAHFTDKHATTQRSRLGSQQRKRFCIQCGMDKRFFTPGTLVKQGDCVRVVCRKCRQLKESGFCKGCMVCAECTRGRREDSCGSRMLHYMMGDELPRLEEFQAATAFQISSYTYPPWSLARML